MDAYLDRTLPIPYRTEGQYSQFGTFAFDQEWWIGYNVKFADWKYDVGEMVLQVHKALKQWYTPFPNDPCPIGNGLTSNPVSITTEYDVMKFWTAVPAGTKTPLYTTALRRNVWQSIVVRLIPSESSNGVVEYWLDGVKVASYRGITDWEVDHCGHLYIPSYLKMGVYKGQWREGSPATSSTTRRIIFDNVKIANGTNGFDLVYTPALNGADTTPPIVSNVQVSNITHNAAQIAWATNEASSSKVNYGTSTNYGSSASSSGNVLQHSVNLTALTPGTTYQYKVESTDASNNTGFGTNLTFTTLTSDTLPPVISNVQATGINNTSATITWTTNENSDSVVEYGTTTAYGNNAVGVSSVTDHSVVLSDLTPGTLYNFRVLSKDPANNLANSNNATFTTTSANLTKPVLTNLQVIPSWNSAVFSWTTDKLSDSRIKVNSPVLTTSSIFDSTMTTNHSMTFTGLPAETQITFKVTSKDSSGNPGELLNQTFSTLAVPQDTIISNVSVSDLRDTSVTFTWTTNVPSTTCYRIASHRYLPSYTCDPALVTQHTATITGLVPNRVYYYRLKSDSAVPVSAETGQASVMTRTRSYQKSDPFSSLDAIGPLALANPGLLQVH